MLKGEKNSKYVPKSSVVRQLMTQLSHSVSSDNNQVPFYL